jgi:flavin-dependent dehydrogenase
MPSAKKTTVSAKGTAKKTTRSPAIKPGEAATGDPSVLIVGSHPAAWLCALFLHDAKVNVAVIEAGTRSLDRLVTLNPAFFNLHKRLNGLRDTLPVTPINRARFLGHDNTDATSHEKKGEKVGPLTFITPLSAIRKQLKWLALDGGVRLCEGAFNVEQVDERGAHCRLGRQALLPRVLAICDSLEPDIAARVDIKPFGRSRLWTLATTGLTARGRTPRGSELADDVLPLSLELDGCEAWGWLMRQGDVLELSVLSRTERGEEDSKRLLDVWAGILRDRGLLCAEASPDGRTLQMHSMPLAGALERDVVGRRTVLFGPAGGFLSASGEEIYPACWSAKYAADAAAKAARASHPQDALASYRGQWGSTIGDYLRGPQQNLQFLMPLVYRNPPMTDRLADAVLRGQSLVK